MEDEGVAEDIEQLGSLIRQADHIVGFTGAGISTESGIPDYRSQGGIWDRFKPVYFQEFLSDDSKRLEYWRRKWELWPAIDNAVPGPGHLFFARLFSEGKLAGLITQNIDGLHERSDIPSDLVVNLHGTSLETTCLSCGMRVSSSSVFETYDLDDGSPTCRDCGGLLKPATVSFGQSLDSETLQKTEALAESCNLMIAMGSTLLVHPAASIPEIALRNQAQLAIVTLSPTPIDDSADLVINRPIGTVVESVKASFDRDR